jgi:hypothetical protein
MKSELNQELKSFGVLTVLGLIGFSAMVIAAPWKHFETSSENHLMRQRAEIIGYQVAQIRRDKAEKVKIGAGLQHSSRLPSSISVKGDELSRFGKMGSDPWDQPFHYRILSPESTKTIEVLVWSTGPNQRSDSSDLDDESILPSKKPKYGGDDDGVLIKVYEN